MTLGGLSYVKLLVSSYTQLEGSSNVNSKQGGSPKSQHGIRASLININWGGRKRKEKKREKRKVSVESV